MQCQDKVYSAHHSISSARFLNHDLLHSIFLFDVINLLKNDILSGIKNFM